LRKGTVESSNLKKGDKITAKDIDNDKMLGGLLKIKRLLQEKKRKVA